MIVQCITFGELKTSLCYYTALVFNTFLRTKEMLIHRKLCLISILSHQLDRKMILDSENVSFSLLQLEDLAC